MNRSCVLLSNILGRTLTKSITFESRSQIEYLRTRSVSFRLFSSWEIVASVCLERKPIITQELSCFEEQSKKFFRTIEDKKSYLSDHEIRHIKDSKRAERIKQGILEDIDAAIQQTARDFEDQCVKEVKNFMPTSRITEADLASDRKSTERKLDSNLVLVVKQKLGNDYAWCLPQAIHKEGESLQETAKRGLEAICGDSIKVQFMGNAPVGFYKYKYPKLARSNGVCGAKVFFFKARLQSGNLRPEFVENSACIEDYYWLLQSELHSLLKPVYYKAVDSILWHDDAVVCENFDEPQKAVESLS